MRIRGEDKVVVIPLSSVRVILMATLIESALPVRETSNSTFGSDR
jgi:hypothetical protein